MMEGEPIVEAGTAAARHGNAQKCALGFLLRLENSDAPRRALADDDPAFECGAALRHGKLLKMRGDRVSLCSDVRRIVKPYPADHCQRDAPLVVCRPMSHAAAPAPYACKPEESRGRLHAEAEAALRSPFQRDRDRIIHS